jgi:hypothetical protein
MTDLGEQAVYESSLRALDLSTGREVRHFPGLGNTPQAVAVSPDGRTVAAGDWSGDVSLWEVASGKLRRRMPGHRGQIFSLAYSPDSRLLASGSMDRTALIWDLTGTADSGGPRSGEATEIEKLWDDLGGSDAVRAGIAVWCLAADPERAVPFISKQLKPVALPGSARVGQLIADLDADQFEKRDSGQRELEALGELALPTVRAALASNPSAEMRRRLTAILERIEQQTLTGLELQTLRALEVLEHAQRPDARQVLERLSRGAPAARQTQEARSALERLKQQDGR